MRSLPILGLQGFVISLGLTGDMPPWLALLIAGALSAWIYSHGRDAGREEAHDQANEVAP